MRSRVGQTKSEKVDAESREVERRRGIPSFASPRLRFSLPEPSPFAMSVRIEAVVGEIASVARESRSLRRSGITEFNQLRSPSCYHSCAPRVSSERMARQHRGSRSPCQIYYASVRPWRSNGGWPERRQMDPIHTQVANRPIENPRPSREEKEIVNVAVKVIILAHGAGRCSKPIKIATGCTRAFQTAPKS